MPWGPRKFRPSRKVVRDINEIALAAEEGRWFFVGYMRNAIHAKALGNWQFTILHDAVRRGSIRYAAITPEWLKANSVAAEEIICDLPF